jgi:preprotein translocase subunit SecG
MMLQAIVTFLIVLLSFILIGLVLLQKNRGSGLSGAFGGAGGSSAFGTKTGDVLTWVTVGVTAAFLFMFVIGNYVFQPSYTNPPASIGPAGGTPVAPPAGTPGGPQPGATPPANPGQPAGANETPGDVNSPAPAQPRPSTPTPSDEAPQPVQPEDED